MPDSERAVQGVRERITTTLASWGIEESVIEDVELLASELTTNAIVYGSSPISVRLRHNARHVVLEVYDSATYLPRRMRPTPDDEHGRGLQLVALARRTLGDASHRARQGRLGRAGVDVRRRIGAGTGPAALGRRAGFDAA